MGHIAQRFGIHIGRRWTVAFLVLLAGLLAAWWIGPLRAQPPAVELLAVQDGSLTTEVEVRGEYDEAENTLRFPVPLAARNIGTSTAEPRRVVLSVPARFRVVGPRGRITGEVTPGVPLRRYVLDVTATPLAPGAEPQQLPGLEQIWLEPDLPTYYCTTRGGVIPEFIPAPDVDAATVADVRIFYSVHMRGRTERSTGVLRVRMDPTQLNVTPAPMPPAFPTVATQSEADAPDLGVLRFAGTRTAWCGDPDQPMELYTAMWEGAGGSRVFSIHVRGEPRKRLYDLNGDGIIDLETWDVDGDGRFDARRQARFATPDLLVPLPPRNPQLREPVTTPPDPAWLAVFGDVGAGPFRFARHGPPPEALAADTLDAGMPPTAREGAVAMGPLPPPDSAWLAIFDDVGAGPFRFTRRPPAQPPVAGPPEPAPGAPTTPTTPPTPGMPGTPPPVAADSPVAPPVAEPAPAPARPPPRRVPLGTPVRPDTIPPRR
jgi:hypothetical protein